MNSQWYKDQAQQLTKKLERGIDHVATFPLSYKNLRDPANQEILKEWIENIKTSAVLEFMVHHELVEDNSTFSLNHLHQVQQSFELALQAHESKVQYATFQEIKGMLHATTLELRKL